MKQSNVSFVPSFLWCCCCRSSVLIHTSMMDKWTRRVDCWNTKGDEVDNRKATTKEGSLLLLLFFWQSLSSRGQCLRYRGACAAWPFFSFFLFLSGSSVSFARTAPAVPLRTDAPLLLSLHSTPERPLRLDGGAAGKASDVKIVHNLPAFMSSHSRTIILSIAPTQNSDLGK